MGKTKSAKVETFKPSSKTETAAPPSVDELIGQAHAYLGQSNFEQAINILSLAIDIEPTNAEATEVLAVAEIEGGDVHKGRELLQRLLPPHIESPAPSTYLYLAQTAPTPQDALQQYEAAVKLLESKLAGLRNGMVVTEDNILEETEEEVAKECVAAYVAMIEIWMSDLCFEPEASTQCDQLIARALAVDENDIDALLTLSSIRMSQSRTEEAKDVILKVSNLVLEIIDRIEQAEEQGEAAVEAGQEPVGQDVDIVGRDRLPSIPTRHLLTRLLLEHHLYIPALRVNDSVRSEDELELEGSYLEGWAWYCRGEALDEGEESAKALLPSEDVTPSKMECWTEALSSFVEANAVLESDENADEGIRAHVKELIPLLESAGVKVPVEEDGQEGGADVPMS